MHMSRSGRIAAVLVVFGSACGPSTPPVDRASPPPGDGPGQDDELPAVPATIDAEATKPTEGHTPSARSPLLDLMAEENKRWIEALGARDDEPAYYIGYQVHEKRQVVIEAEGGALVEKSDDEARALDVEVRVGNPELDNRHPLPDDRLAALSNLPRIGSVPFGHDELAVRTHLWLETGRRYREAALQLRNVKTQRSVTADSNESADFSHAEPQTFIEPEAKLAFDRDKWRARMRDCSERAVRGVATRGSCRADFERNTVYFVNSEGTELQQSWTTARVTVNVGVKADDGMPLQRVEQRFAATPGALPPKAEIDRMIETVTSDLDALHAAPVVEPYVGPAVLQGRAAAVFFHEVFGHRVEAHRQEGKTSGQTFSSKVGEKVMPQWLSVYDDPTLTRLGGRYLNGFYRFDDEGVKAQRAPLVDGGVLEGFVQGRDPIEKFPTSNGHGRKEPGRPAVSRQGNLVVDASRSVPEDELVDRLIREVKRQDKPYGMVFTDISGGVTNTTRFAPQAFKVHPVMAYRVYPDGRRELVRGVDIVGTPLTALRSIEAAGRPVETFNGMCGAESGWVPVSASSPSLLLESVEVERSFKPTNRPPVLPPPAVSR